ncbi:MAG: thiamine-phosphate kinase [Alphaproteobacteria bacterium]
MTEFEMIERYFVPLTMGQAGAAGLRDDGAVVDIPDGHQLVVTSDTLNADTHFLIDELPENIARKALRVNLSDLASMGAKPLCYQLNLAFSEKPSDAWLSAFSNALQEDNEYYGVYCSGGDTTSIKGGYLSISITAMGVVPKGRAVRRGGAKDGDLLIVTGEIGDAALGLKAIRAGRENDFPIAVSRYRVPEPKVMAFDAMQKYANAAADVSDGLLADMANIAESSALGVEIDPSKVPISKDVQRALVENFISWQEILSSGDDYELIMAISKGVIDELQYELQKNDIKSSVIGEFRSNILGVSILNTLTDRIDVKTFGWKHF